MRVSADVDGRTLREIYLRAFERGSRSPALDDHVRVQPDQRVSVPEHRWLLTEVLREDLGFEGLVAVRLGCGRRPARSPRRRPRPGDATEPTRPAPPAVVAAVREGRLDESVLDDSVRRVLRLVNQAKPAIDRGRGLRSRRASPAGPPGRRWSRQSCSRTKGTRCPLRPAAGDSRVALIGEFARTPRYPGRRRLPGEPHPGGRALTDELAARTRAGSGDRRWGGFGVDNTDDDDHASGRGGRRRHAVLITSWSAWVSRGSAESEGFDRTHMDLPANQIALMEALAVVSDRPDRDLGQRFRRGRLPPGNARRRRSWNAGSPGRRRPVRPQT